MVSVYTPVGEIFQYPVNECTTVESLLQDHVWKEKFFLKEPDSELYWLYKYIEKSDHFDQPLSKDKKVLKILAKNEKDNMNQRKKEEENSKNPSEDGKRFSFMRKKTSKFLRKQTIAAQMETMQENWVDN